MPLGHWLTAFYQVIRYREAEHTPQDQVQPSCQNHLAGKPRLPHAMSVLTEDYHKSQDTDVAKAVRANMQVLRDCRSGPKESREECDRWRLANTSFASYH